MDEGLFIDQDELAAADSPHSSFCDDEALEDYSVVLEYPSLEYNGSLLGSWNAEVCDWFSHSDLTQLATVLALSKSILYRANDSSVSVSLYADLKSSYADNGSLLAALIKTAYYTMGCYGDTTSAEDLQRRVFNNVCQLVKTEGFVDLLVDILIDKANNLVDIERLQAVNGSQGIELASAQFFWVMTIFHFVLSIFLTDSDVIDYSKELKNILYNSKVLLKLVKAIDQWKWLSSKSDLSDTSAIIEIISSKDAKHKTTRDFFKTITNFKIRNVIILINDLTQFLFGDRDHIDSTREFLDFFHNSKTSSDFSISSIDYAYYKKELTTRYPMFKPKEYKSSEIIEMATYGDDKLSKSLNINTLMINQHQHLKNHKQLNGLVMSNGPPDIHIATPMPSPTLSPQHTGGSRNYCKVTELEHPTLEVKKKLFVTQSNFPNLTPHGTDPPQSIKDASDILFSHIKDDFNTKQFIETFEQYVKDEHGTQDENFQSQFTYTDKTLGENPMFEEEIHSLQRVDQFYNECKPYLSSLISVLLKILVSNIIPTHQTSEDGQTRQRQVIGSKLEKKPFISTQLTSFEKQKLEVHRLKETMLKSASSILYLFQEWFKLSHIMKLEYFNTLLFDQDYLIHLFRYLDSNKIQSQSAQYNLSDPKTLLNNILIYCDYETLYSITEYSFTLTCINLSSNANKIIHIPKEPSLESIFIKRDPPNNLPHASFSINPSYRAVCITSNLLYVLNSIITPYKLHRIYKLIDVRPTDILRFYLHLHTHHLITPILGVVKAMSPFIGKKWRANNMDLISGVYLWGKVGLKDGWLGNWERAGGGGGEDGIRSLIAFYNKMGEKREKPEWFTIECLDLNN
ncbi:Far11 protein [Martiniozyma asiatica (nom. inval.)]|nr:Far11 protein [Martiniozyma asiatica]